jgi:hypothetical protein
LNGACIDYILKPRRTLSTNTISTDDLMRSDSPGLEVNSSSNGRDTHVVIPFETPSVDNDRGPNLSQAHVRRWSDINDQEQLELEDDLDGAIPTRNLLRNPNWCWANGSSILSE